MRAVAIRRIFAGLICMCGCGWTALTAFDEDEQLAREALIAALEAWKSGQTTSLGQRNPPIRFVDDDVSAGTLLTEYELDQPDTAIIPFRNVRVLLILRDRGGQAIEKVALYQVALEPRLTVLRSDH